MTAQGVQRAPVEHVDALAIHPDVTRVAIAGGGALVVQSVTGEVSEVIGAPLGISALAVDRGVTRLAFGTSAGAVGLLDVAGGTIAGRKGTPTRSMPSRSRRMARRSRAWPATRRHASGT